MAKTRRKVQPKRKAPKAPAKRKATKARSAKPARKKANAKARKPQRFVVSHHREQDFDHGLRAYSAYRDLGIAAATDGMVQAHVIRMTKPFEEGEVSTPHLHDVDFQMVYVLKGWFRTELEGEGVHTFTAGSCWIQPPRIR
ncbi:MAG TPA: hypothetical protein VHL34_17330, partial [Rhizomicrobium sp.]|nr:hypothetical protein [Rhizomicrobium sp.]